MTLWWPNLSCASLSTWKCLSGICGMFMELTIDMGESVSFVVEFFPFCNYFEIHLQKGSVLCICSNISFQTSVRGADALTLVVSCCDNDGISGDITFWDAFVLLQVWVAGPSVWDTATEFMRMPVDTELSGTSTKHDQQSAASFCAPDIHSKVILCVANSSNHWFTLLFAFLPCRNFWKGLWSLWMTISNCCR